MKQYISQPDPNTVSLLDSIRMNPNFLKLVAFSLNCLYSQMYLPTTRHRDNALYLYKNHFDLMVEIIEIHVSSDTIIQYGCGCLHRMIGIHKFRDAEISQKVIQSRVIEVLSKGMGRCLNMECIKQLLEFYSNLTYLQQRSPHLCKGVNGLLNLILNSRPQYQEMRVIFDIVYRLLVQSIIINEIDVAPLCESLLLLLSEFNDNLYVVRQALKLLELLIKNERAKVIMKQCISPNKLSELLQNYNEIDINERGARVLVEIISQEQIEQCLLSIENQDSQAQVSLGLIACLIPAIYTRIDLEKFLNILHLILTKRVKPLLKDSLNALCRLADQDIEVEKFYQLALGYFEYEDQEIAGAAMELVRRMNVDDKVKMIERLLKCLHKNPKEVLRLLVTLTPYSQDTIKASGKGREDYFKLLEKVQNAQVHEYNGKLLLMINEEQYIEKHQNQIHKFILKHHSWKKAVQQYVRVLNKCKCILSDDLLTGLVCVVYDKDYGEDEDEEYDEECYEIVNINEDCKQLIYHIGTQDHVFQYTQKLNQKDNLELTILKLALLIQLYYPLNMDQQLLQILKQNNELYKCVLSLLQRVVINNIEISNSVFKILKQLYEKDEAIEECLDTLLIMDSKIPISEDNCKHLLTTLENYMRRQQHLQDKILKVIHKYLNTFKLYLQDLPKILCRKLPEDTREQGMTTIEILSDLQYFDNTLKYTTQFGLEHSYDVEVTNKLVPYIQNNPESYLTEDIKKDILFLITAQQQDIKHMERLGMHSLLKEALDYEVELEIDQYIKDRLELSDRFLCCSCNILIRMGKDHKLKGKQFTSQILIQLDQYIHSKEVVSIVLEYLNTYEICCEDPTHYFNFLEEFSLDEFIINNTYQVLFRSCQQSPELAKQIGTKKFISRLVRQYHDEQEMICALEWLTILSQHNPENVYSCGGGDLAKGLIGQRQGRELLSNLIDYLEIEWLKSILNQYIQQTLNLILKMKEDRIQQSFSLDDFIKYKDDYQDEIQKLISIFQYNQEQPQVQEELQKEQEVENLQQQQQIEQNEIIQIDNQQILQNIQLQQGQTNLTQEQVQECVALLEKGEYVAEVMQSLRHLKDEDLEKFAQGEGVDLLMNQIEKNIEDKVIIGEGIKTFNEISKEEAVLYKLADGEGVDISKKVIEKHNNDKDIILGINQLVGKMSVSEEYQEKMDQVGIVDQMIEMIKKNENEEIVQSALVALSKLVYKNQSNSEKVVQSGILDNLQVSVPALELLRDLEYQDSQNLQIEFFINAYKGQLEQYDAKLYEICVSTLFKFAKEYAKKMVELQLPKYIAEHLNTQQQDLATLNLLYIINKINSIEIDKSLTLALLKCIEHEKLEQPALRLLKGNPIHIENYDGFIRVLKRQERSSIILCLEILLQIEPCENLPLEELVIDDMLLFNLVCDYSLKIKNAPSKDLVEFAQHQQLDGNQTNKLLQILAKENTYYEYVPYILTLGVQYNISHLLERVKNPDYLYVNQVVPYGVKTLQQKFEQELVSTLLFIAQSSEEYRQEMSSQFVDQLNAIKDERLKPLIDYLKKPKQRISRLTDEIKKFLIQGEILKMYKKDGSRGYYRQFCDETLNQFQWKPDKQKTIKQKWILPIKQITSIKYDYDVKSLESSEFNNMSWFSKTINKIKNKIIDPKKCFTLNSKSRNYNALCKSEGQKQKWVEYIEILIEEEQYKQQ